MWSSQIQEGETNHGMTTPDHPQTNGLVEGLDHTLAGMLSMYLNPFFLPFFLVHSREARIPIDVMLGSSPRMIDEKSLNGPLDHIIQARDFVWEKIKIIQQIQKELTDDSRRTQEDLGIGDQVLVYMQIRKVGIATKLLYDRYGPYQIVDLPHEFNCAVKQPRGKKIEIIDGLDCLVDFNQGLEEVRVSWL